MSHLFVITQVKAEDLLKNMFPNLTHVRTLVRGRRVVDHLEDVTIMFSDLKGYTQWASEESPKEVYRVLNKVRGRGTRPTVIPRKSHNNPTVRPDIDLFWLNMFGRATLLALSNYSSAGQHG